MISRFDRFRATSGVLALATMLAAAPAAAQSNLPPPTAAGNQSTTADPTGEIVVTGSRIRRDPLAQDAPITFVDQQDIARTGLNSITDVLQRLPSSGGGLNGKFNNSGNFGNPPDGGGVGAGAAEIDLRYLGSKRTLVLVDGLRFVNGASASGVPGSVDLNAIPESMIERVEVLQGGASAIYGSDAIAGVVNIITKSRQKGLIASAQVGEYQQGDGTSQNYQISWGNGGNGPTQIVIGGNYVKQGSISSGDRDISLFPEPGATSCLAGGCSSGTPLGRFIVLGQNLTLRGPVIGRRPVYNPANPTDPASDFKAFTTADRFNFAPYNLIQIPLERYGAFANLKQEFGPDLNFSAKLLWNRRNSANQAAPLPLFVGPDAGNGNLLDRISISATNPYNPFGVTLQSGVTLGGVANGTTPNYSFIGRRLIENGPRRYEQRVDTTYGTATLDGKFAAFNHDWFWDVNGLYGRNKARQTVHGNVNAANLAQALGPIGACTGACVPFNIFGGVGSITQQMLDFVAFTQRDRSRQSLWGASANLTGGLFELPGGPLSLAVGAEYRKYRGRFDPDATVAAGLGSDIPALPTRGSYDVKEAYAELSAPLLKGVPFADLLELGGAVRFSDYSTSGSTTTFKGDVNWKPVRDLRFRANYAEGFRAPTIGELFGTPSRFDQELTDPCSGTPTGSTLANCRAQGVPAGYVQNNPQISVITGGNQGLKPETSKSWGVGGVYSPSWLARTSLEVNYYNVKVKGAIQAIDANTTLQQCVIGNDPVACALITRTASGQIANIQGLLQNIAGLKTDGLDVNFTYRSAPGPLGSFGVTLNNNFLFKYRVSVPALGGSTTIKREGTEQGSPDQAFPKWKGIGILDWNLKGFGASLTGRYIRHVTESQNGNRLGDRFYTDAQLRWEPEAFGQQFGFAFGVNNLFDKDPPGCISCGLNNYDPTTYDIPGRYFYLRATVKMF
ncbi:TonB-dependent receptor [Sphingomonas ginkgonis]|uniref:TonB-dependent receptor n=1 Tax=Sphingomonas ginkgonis TaxID=2315330 RepID=A0A3R9X8A8_9SPHN|nr:TonB-dependent receptor [Sphingomonas ginkgonis]RST31163.1 TonB-dependent receptor [Sphingomonas ginkgonis]